MPNKELLITYAQNKLKISELEKDNEFIKDQVLKEVHALIGDTDQKLELTEFPGCSYSLAKARAKWDYTAETKAAEEALKATKKEEEQLGKAINLNEGKRELRFNVPREE